jgi:hypothetical protein
MTMAGESAVLRPSHAGAGTRHEAILPDQAVPEMRALAAPELASFRHNPDPPGGSHRLVLRI